MSNISLIKARNLLNKWSKLTASDSIKKNSNIDFVYKIKELKGLISSAVKATGLQSLYNAKDLVTLEMNYYDPTKLSQSIDKDSKEIIKLRYKEAKSDLAFVEEKIKEIEENTYIEMK